MTHSRPLSTPALPLIMALLVGLGCTERTAEQQQAGREARETAPLSP
jgi:hypothetical protein